MRLREVMAAADGIRPNTVDDALKARWIEELEAKFAETQQIKKPEEVWPKDKDLLMPKPVDRVYLFWLCAMIDWAQLDLDMYAVDQTMYEQAYKEACSWWRRHYPARIKEAGGRIEP